MKHYFNPMSRAATTAWMLAELDVPHEQVLIEMPAGENAEYREINPMGKVPALVDGDVLVTESAAICAYLADRFPEKKLAPPPDSPERGRYYRYLFFPVVTLEPFLAVVSLGVDEWSPVSMGWGDRESVMATVEAMTPETGWALGESFTTADVVFGGALAFFSGFGMMEPTSRVSAYIDRIKARPAYQATHQGVG
jgi:glutathione S-transferase